MSNPRKTSPFKGKRLLWRFAACVMFLIISWVVYFFATFDLNDYRSKLETQLSQQLSLPIRLGQLSFQFNMYSTGLRVQDIRVGNANTNIEIQAPNLLFTLKWTAIFQGRLEFLQISLEKPHLRYRVQHPQRYGLSDLNLWLELSIKNLLIRNGNFDILFDNGINTKRLNLSSVEASFKGLRPDSPTKLNVKGYYQVDSSRNPPQPFRIQGHVNMPMSISTSKQSQFNLDMLFAGVNTDDLSFWSSGQALRDRFSGVADLKLVGSGSFSEGISFQATLKSKGLLLTFDSDSPTQFTIKTARLSGHWYAADTKHHFEDLSCQLDDNVLQGTLIWDSSSTRLDLYLNNSKLTTGLIKLLSSRSLSQHKIDFTLPTVNQGQILIDQAKLNFLKSSEPQQTGWKIEAITGQISELSLTGKGIKQLVLKSLLFSYSEGSLQISQGKSILGQQVIEFEGQIAQLDSNRPTINLNVVGTLAADWFEQFWPEETYAPIALMGTIPLSGQIQGSLTELNIDFQADLDSLQLLSHNYLNLSAQSGDRLTISSKLKDNVLILEHVEVKYASMALRINGQFPLGNATDSTLTALISVPDLSVLPKVSPKLAKLNLEGQAELSITQQGRVVNGQPEVYLTLRNAKVSTDQTLFDINSVNGRFYFSKQGLSSQHLQAHLGSALVNATVTLQDYDDPVISIDFSIPRIRADELIFFSDSIYLKDVNGHLIIDKKAIHFSPVNLTLDGGSTPEVNGSVIFGNPVIVDLTVSSTYANIEEIIQLWTKETDQSKLKRLERKSQKPADRHAPKITIKAKIEEGSLFGMHFRDAKAHITPTTRQLIIHPLDFYVGDGYCNGQVIVDYPAENNSTLLRISGHVEDVDAFQVYDELLKQKNIVRGLLRGDFYLQGIPGPNYLSSSYGHFSFEINNGVLRKFHILSKVFSLLNISQLFALQLPDMDSEGLPFQKLSANFLLNNGKLTTEDLLIRSESMNQSYQGSFSLIDKELDLLLAIHPLRTIDKIVSHLPVAGWVLGGDDKALITVHFRIEGPVGSATVTPAPITSLSEKTIGLVRRTLSLPFKLVTDPNIIWGLESQTEKKTNN